MSNNPFEEVLAQARLVRASRQAMRALVRDCANPQTPRERCTGEDL